MSQTSDLPQTSSLDIKLFSFKRFLSLWNLQGGHAVVLVGWESKCTYHGEPRPAASDESWASIKWLVASKFESPSWLFQSWKILFSCPAKMRMFIHVYMYSVYIYKLYLFVRHGIGLIVDWWRLVRTYHRKHRGKRASRAGICLKQAQPINNWLRKKNFMFGLFGWSSNCSQVVSSNRDPNFFL